MLKVRYKVDGRLTEKTIPADRVSALEGLVVFSKVSDEGALDVLLVVPGHAVVDVFRVETEDGSDA